MYFGMYFGMYLAMYLACTVSHVPGEDRRVEMACILTAHAHYTHKTGCDMDNEEIDWNRMGF